MDNFKVYGHQSPNGKLYIGITSQTFMERFGGNGHRYKRCTKLYRAINKYGWENFKTYIFAWGLSKEEAEKLEIELIADLNTVEDGYNISSGGDCGNFGTKRSLETRLKMSKSMKGRKRVHSEETRRKLSLAHKGKIISDETKEKCRIGSLGNTNRSKPVICDGVVYDSIKLCSEAIGIPRTTINAYLNGRGCNTKEIQKHEIKYVTKKEK